MNISPKSGGEQTKIELDPLPIWYIRHMVYLAYSVFGIWCIRHMVRESSDQSWNLLQWYNSLTIVELSSHKSDLIYHLLFNFNVYLSRVSSLFLVVIPLETIEYFENYSDNHIFGALENLL